MRTIIKSSAGFSLLGLINCHVNPAMPEVTAFHTVEVVARQDAHAPNIHIAAIEPTMSGQIGVNPPAPEPFSGSVGPHTKLLVQSGDTYSWVGEDPSHITVIESTKTKDGDTTVVTVTQDVSIATNAAGGLDLVMSPYLKDKLNAIAGEVTTCGAAKRAARRRRNLQRRQGGPVCGSLDFANRVSQDADLSDFSSQLDEAVRNSIDSGYESMSSVDGDGWVDSISEDGSEVVENFIISTEEEAAAVAGAAADGVAADAIFSGTTITTGSFLAMLWSSFSNSGKVEPVYQLPKESVHKISKTSSETTDEPTATTSSASCPSPTEGFRTCGSDCVPTRVASDGAKETQGIGWACSEGKNKDCECSAGAIEFVTPYDSDLQKRIWTALKNTENAPEEPELECDGKLSNVPSEFVPDIIKDFCPDAMKSKDGISAAGRAYDIYGDQIPTLKMALAVSTQDNKKRSPPESQDSYEDYRFFLHWEPSEGECMLDKENLCEEAFEVMRKARCGNNHGSAGDRMTETATIDVGCGEFGWKVEEGPGSDTPKLGLKERECNDPKSKHDVHDGQQEDWASMGCRWFSDKTMKSDSDKIYWHPTGFAADWYQNFQISWIDGCDLVEEQNAAKPIPGDDVSCFDIMRGLYKDCNNKGTGGSREAGCLLYEFWKK